MFDKKLKLKKIMLICLFVTEEIHITVARQAPDKEARPNPKVSPSPDLNIEFSTASTRTDP